MKLQVVAATAALLILSGPLMADCVSEIAELEEMIESPMIEASNEAREAAKIEKEAAVTLCTDGDETGAAEHIATAKAMLEQ